jgi:hypothetical protein
MKLYTLVKAVVIVLVIKVFINAAREDLIEKRKTKKQTYYAAVAAEITVLCQNFEGRKSGGGGGGGYVFQVSDHAA